MTTVNCRIIQKHGTETDWVNSELVPYKGELIVYDPDDSHSYSRFKVGDGVHNVTELPFSVVQSDWNENDENASDFIKNKPFYEAEVLSIIYEGQVDLTMRYYSFLSGTLEKEILCEKGKTYNVTLNGENDESIYQGEVVCEQDGSLNFDIPDSLFYAEISGDRFNIYSNDDYFDDIVFGEGIYNLKIEGNGITLKTLDEKFIPDTIARVEDIPEINYPVTSVNGQTGDVQINIPEQVQSDWNQTDETATNYIKNKPILATSEEIKALFS